MTTYEASNGNAVPDVPPAPDHAPQLRVKRLKLSKLRSANGARIILGSVLGLLLIITWIVNNPGIHSGSNPSDWRADLTEAAVTNELNAGETKGAPQQSVVNGWYLNDIAVVQAAQNSYIAGSSMRNGNLLTLIGLGVAGELSSGALKGQPGSGRSCPDPAGDWTGSLLVVDVAAVPYGHNHNEQNVILDRIDDPVVTNTDPITRTAAQGNCFGRPRVLAEERDGTLNAFFVLGMNVL